MSDTSWRDGVVYQIYPRSFCDSNGDGIGDLPGIRSKLDHLEYLGVDAVWLSPFYPSPMADFGYDVSDYEGVDPVFGTLDDFDALVADLHARDIRLMLDFVPCHTSIEHSWFTEHPDWYIWADGRPDGGPPNNWVAAFGGSAWTYDDGRGKWYLHSFYPEQPDLDWRNPEVEEAIGKALRFWLDRGVDGFRLDAIDRLMKDPELRDDPPRTTEFPFPLDPEEAKLELTHSRNAEGIEHALASIRRAVGDTFLVGEVYLPTEKVTPYLDHLDRFFVFELLFAGWDREKIDAAIRAGTSVSRREGTGPAWVMSNHDFGWLASRVGPAHAEEALELLLSLPGTAFLYQGDEFGMQNGPDTGQDRYGRDSFRVPLTWEPSPMVERTRELIASRKRTA